MEYPLACECGATLRVPEGAAGSRLRCACGRDVAVPSLTALKRLSGLPGVAATFAVEQLLLAGKLPEERECVLCGAATAGIAHYWVSCERAVTFRRRWLEVNDATLLTAWFGHLTFTEITQTGEHGRDRLFRLPLRVCPDCGELVRGEEIIKEALGRVPLYRQLLDEFPEAKVSAG